MRLRLTLAVVLALLAAACSGGGETSGSTATTQTFTDPAMEQFEWLLEAAQTGVLGADVLNERFSQGFLQRVGDLGVITGLVELGLTSGEWEVAEAEFGLFDGVGIVRNADGDRIQLLLSTRSVPPYEIDELRASPISPEFVGGVSEESVDERIQQLGTANWGVFEVDGHSCVPLLGTQINDPGPIAGAFDLWVLAALAEAVERGDATFTEQYAVVDDLKSALESEIGGAVEGSSFPLVRYAELMTAFQDNSAADHLIERLGREAIETAAANAGVANPELNRPLLTTREFFVLKFMALGDSIADYLALDEAGKRTFLSDELRGVSLEDIVTPGIGWDAPTLIFDIEWLASPADLCRTHAYLADLATRPGLGQISTILGTAAGVPLDEEVWTGFHFKSGTEPGVFTAAWLLTRHDGRVFVVAGTLFDTGSLVDDGQAIALFQAAIDLAAAA